MNFDHLGTREMVNVINALRVKLAEEYQKQGMSYSSALGKVDGIIIAVY